MGVRMCRVRANGNNSQHVHIYYTYRRRPVAEDDQVHCRVLAPESVTVTQQLVQNPLIHRVLRISNLARPRTLALQHSESALSRVIVHVHPRERAIDASWPLVARLCEDHHCARVSETCRWEVHHRMTVAGVVSDSGMRQGLWRAEPANCPVLISLLDPHVCVCAACYRGGCVPPAGSVRLEAVCTGARTCATSPGYVSR